MWISGLLVVGSLLAVVVGDALVTQGQVRLSTTEGALAAAVAKQKTLQIAVAMKAAPPVVVSQAKKQGLVAASQVVYLPQVPLNVPLAPPRIVPNPPGTATTPATTTPPANAATSTVPTPPPAATAPATTAPATTAPASTTPSTTPATTAAGAQ
jgi:5'-nucleotidase